MIIKISHSNFIAGVIIATLIFGIVFLCGFFWTRLNMVRNEAVQLRDEFNDIRYLGEEIMLYQRIEKILRERGAGKLNEEVRTELARIIYQHHKKFGTEGEIPIGLDYWRIFAWIEVESMFDPHAVSYAGAIGLTQIMLGTGISVLRNDFGMSDISAELAKKILADPAWNLRIGLRLLVNYQQEHISLGHASPEDWKWTLTRYCWSQRAFVRLIEASRKSDPKASLLYATTIEERIPKYRGEG